MEQEKAAGDGKLLEIRELVVRFRTKNGVLTAIDQVDLSIGRGEILGIVGESGCGKSVTAMAILGLNPKQSTVVSKGQILFEGRDLLRLEPKQLRAVRGGQIAMIFQDSLTGLDPVRTVGSALVEAAQAHQKISRRDAWNKGIEMLKRVGIPLPEQRMREYPHQLSGGMRQRVMICLSLLHDAQLLIADEPTTALDVTIQAQILELLKAQQRERGTSVLLITHDMGVVAETTDRVAVMYAGEVVETASTRELFEHPLHPYTRSLLRAIPRLNQDESEQLYTICGSVPPLGRWPSGCRFCSRCRYASERCRTQHPEFTGDPAHPVKCWNCQTIAEDNAGEAPDAAEKGQVVGAYV